MLPVLAREEDSGHSALPACYMLPCFSEKSNLCPPFLAKIALPRQFRPPHMPKALLKLPYILNREGAFALGGCFDPDLAQLSKTAGCDLEAYGPGLAQLGSTPS